MKKNKIFRFLFYMTVFICLTAMNCYAKEENAVNVQEDKAIYVKGDAGAVYANEKITVLLLSKTGSFPENIIYANEVLADENGAYSVRIPVTDFTFSFDEKGLIDNAALYVNAKGKALTYSVKKATVKAQLVETQVSASAPDKITLALNNPYSVPDATVQIIVAGYKNNGAFAGCYLETVSSTQASAVLEPDFSNAAEISNYKIMFWHQLETMIPLSNYAEFKTVNLIENASFEEDFGTQWFSGYWGSTDMSESEQAHSGSKSIRFNSSYRHNGIRSMGYLPELNENGSGTYRFGCWVKASAATRVKAVLTLRDSSGVYASSDLCPYTSVAAEGDWTFIEGTADINLSGNEIDAYVEIVSEANKVDVYVDDVSLETVVTKLNPPEEKKRIILVGDSICTYYDAENSRRGWGQIMEERINSTDCVVMNTATGAWSTKTYLEGRTTNGRFIEGERWSTIKSLMREGDYVFISLAHNDWSGQYMIPVADYKANLEKMIADVKNCGAIPVFVTAVPPVFESQWTGAGTLNDSGLASYVNNMVQVAKDNNVLTIDLYSELKTKYNNIGKTATLAYYDVNNGDYVHINADGANMVCDTLFELIRNSGNADLIRYFAE